MPKKRKCRPVKYAVINGENITYGWRCAFHHIHTKRYSTEELRDKRYEEHKKEAKKN
jgi:hypothetical protein